MLKIQSLKRFQNLLNRGYLKHFILLCLLFGSLFAFEIKALKNIDELKEEQDALIMFSTTFCPWCRKQTAELESIKASNENIQIFYVKDRSALYKELTEKYPFTIRFYPTTFIVEKEEGELFIKYEFQGYQDEESILKILNDKDNY